MSESTAINEQISIHAPREGGDNGTSSNSAFVTKFQSTPPARGATLSAQGLPSALAVFQSTPPARGATLVANGKTQAVTKISIHAPREGGDSNSSPSTSP